MTMDWPTAAVILGVIGGAVTGVNQFFSHRRDMTMGSMEQKPEASVEEKLVKLQEDVQQVEVDVGILKDRSSRSEQDILSIRGRVDKLFDAVNELKSLMTKYIIEKQA